MNHIREVEPLNIEHSTQPNYNPFEQSDTSTQRVYASPIQPIHRVPEKTEYQPDFFISQVSKRNVRNAIEKGHITEAELPVMYNIALHLSSVFKRRAPTLSDIDMAIQIRTEDRLSELAAGTIQIEATPTRISGVQALPKKEQRSLWEKVAQLTLASLSQASST